MADQERQEISAEDAQELIDAVAETKTPEFEKKLKEKGIPREKYMAALKSVYQDTMTEFAPPAEPSLLGKVMSGAMAFLDWGGGIARNAVMQPAALSTAKGREALVKNFKQDWVDAAWPFDARPAPTTEEWMDRIGEAPKWMENKAFAPLWYTWNLPEKLRGRPIPPTPGPTIKGMLGFGGDVMLSPGGGALGKSAAKLAQADLPVMAKLARALKGKGPLPNQDLMKMTADKASQTLAARAEEAVLNPNTGRGKALKNFLMDPLGYSAEQAGQGLYRGTFQDADRISQMAGHGRVSDALSERGVWGLPETQYFATKGLAKKEGKAMSGLTQEITEEELKAEAKGEGWAHRIPRKLLREPTKDYLKAQASRAGKTEAAASTWEKVRSYFDDAYPGQKEFNLVELDRIKKDFQDLARKSGAYNDTPIMPSRPTRFTENKVEADVMGEAFRKQAQSARMAEEAIFDDLYPGLGSQFHLRNRDIGSMMESLPALEKKYRYQQSPSPWTRVWAAPPAYLDAARSGAGLLLQRYGRLGGNVGRGVGLGIGGQEARSQSPWTLMEIDLENQ